MREMERHRTMTDTPKTYTKDDPEYHAARIAEAEARLNLAIREILDLKDVTVDIGVRHIETVNVAYPQLDIKISKQIR